MKALKLLIKIFLLSLTFQLPTGKARDLTSATAISRELESLKKKERKKRRPRVRSRPMVVRKVARSPKFKSSQPKAHRFSNQRTLRRMYRNH